MAEDLLEHLSGLEQQLRDKLDGAVAEMAEKEVAELEAQENKRAQHVVDILDSLKGDVNQLREYVQVLTDTPSVNAKAWPMIEKCAEHLHANPCSFHCVHLFFKHIMNGDKSDRANPKHAIEACLDLEVWTKAVEQWFTNKDKPRHLLLLECKRRWPSHGPRRMRKYAETRAANAYRVWHRAVKLEDALHTVLRSEAYKTWEASQTGEDKARAAKIREYIEEPDNWESAKALVKALTPVYKLLRMVDGFTPTTGKIYYKCLRAQEHFQELVESDDAPDWAQQLLDYWVADWGYLHCDMHSMGYLLDPEYHSQSKNCSVELWQEFVRGAKRMLKAAPTSLGLDHNKLTAEYGNYQNKRGVYTTAVIESSKNQPAHEWWQQWGKGEPTLRWVAMRTLAQTTSASCSEQGWNEYDFIHSRRRNRLDPAVASNLTIGHNHARLARKFKTFRFEQKRHDQTDSDDEDECVSA